MRHAPTGQPGVLAVGCHIYMARDSRPLLLAGSLVLFQAWRVDLACGVFVLFLLC